MLPIDASLERGMWWLRPLIPGLGRKSKCISVSARPVVDYIASSRTARATHTRSLKPQQQNKSIKQTKSKGRRRKEEGCVLTPEDAE